MNVQLIDENKAIGIQVPKSGDAGWDLVAMETVSISHGYAKKIPINIKVEIPEGWVGLIMDRSSMAADNWAVTGGVIDSSYRGQIQVVMNNLSENSVRQIVAGNRIAQMVIVPFYADHMRVVDDLNITERNEDGFGSTGK